MGCISAWISHIFFNCLLLDNDCENIGLRMKSSNYSYLFPRERVLVSTIKFGKNNRKIEKIKQFACRRQKLNTLKQET